MLQRKWFDLVGRFLIQSESRPRKIVRFKKKIMVKKKKRKHALNKESWIQKKDNDQEKKGRKRETKFF